MNPKGLREHLVEHYADQSLPADKVEALVAAAGRSAPDGQRRVIYALAACVGLLILSNAYFAYQGRSEKSVPAIVQDVSADPVADMPTARLVALKVCADWCTNCATIVPLFEQLQKRYADAPVRFASLNISSDESREAALARMKYPCAGWAVGQCNAAGEIKLFDCKTSKLLASVTNAEQLPRLERVLAIVLKGETP